MNKPPGNAPDASGWHHGCCCQPVGEEPGWRGGGGKLPESSLSRRGRRLEDRVRMDSNLTADPSPRLQSATVANIEQGLRRTWERLPGVRQLEGIEGAYFFVDRQRGKAIFISLWESEEAMNNSEEMMRPLRAELSEAFAANSVDVEHYEVGEMLVQEIRERRSRGFQSDPRFPAGRGEDPAGTTRDPPGSTKGHRDLFEGVAALCCRLLPHRVAWRQLPARPRRGVHLLRGNRRGPDGQTKGADARPYGLGRDGYQAPHRNRYAFSHLRAGPGLCDPRLPGRLPRG